MTSSYGANRDEIFKNITQQAAELKAGQNGLLALDWNNGNRTVLVDPLLSGLLLGQTLHTKAHEIYRSLLEATGFGALIKVFLMFLFIHLFIFVFIFPCLASACEWVLNHESCKTSLQATSFHEIFI